MFDDGPTGRRADGPTVRRADWPTDRRWARSISRPAEPFRDAELPGAGPGGRWVLIAGLGRWRRRWRAAAAARAGAEAAGAGRNSADQRHRHRWRRRVPDYCREAGGGGGRGRRRRRPAAMRPRSGCCCCSDAAGDGAGCAQASGMQTGPSGGDAARVAPQRRRQRHRGVCAGRLAVRFLAAPWPLAGLRPPAAGAAWETRTRGLRCGLGPRVQRRRRLRGPWAGPEAGGGQCCRGSQAGSRAGTAPPPSPHPLF
jgi:hypothetical protein